MTRQDYTAVIVLYKNVTTHKWPFWPIILQKTAAKSHWYSLSSLQCFSVSQISECHNLKSKILDLSLQYLGVKNIKSAAYNGARAVFAVYSRQACSNACTNSILDLAEEFFAKIHHFLQDFDVKAKELWLLK